MSGKKTMAKKCAGHLIQASETGEGFHHQTTRTLSGPASSPSTFVPPNSLFYSRDSCLVFSFSFLTWFGFKVMKVRSVGGETNVPVQVKFWKYSQTVSLDCRRDESQRLPPALLVSSRVCQESVVTPGCYILPVTLSVFFLSFTCEWIIHTIPSIFFFYAEPVLNANCLFPCRYKLKKPKRYAFSWTISGKCISAFTVTRKLLVSSEEGLRLKSTCKGLENLFLSYLARSVVFRSS